MANSVWPFIPFVVLRGAQIFFAIIVLGLAAHVGSLSENWSAWFSMVTALFTLIGVGFLLVTFFIAPAFTAPLFCLCIDAFLLLFWLISLAGFADQFGVVLGVSNCDFLFFYSELCGSIKGNMAMVVFEFLLFIGTLVFSALWFHRERTGQSIGTTNPEGGQISAGAIGGAPQTHGAYPMHQPNPQPVQYSQDPQQYPQQGYQKPVQ